MTLSSVAPSAAHVREEGRVQLWLSGESLHRNVDIYFKLRSVLLIDLKRR